MTYLIDSFPEKIFWAELIYSAKIELIKLAIFVAMNDAPAENPKIREGEIKKNSVINNQVFFLIKQSRKFIHLIWKKLTSGYYFLKVKF